MIRKIRYIVWAVLFVILVANISSLPVIWDESEPMPVVKWSDPILRIETGNHSVMPSRIAIDKSEKWLVSGSEDKTVRIWEIMYDHANKGKYALKLFKTIRLQIGESKRGEIYAVSISSDGKNIFAAWNGDWSTNDKEFYIYNIEILSGKIVQVIPIEYIVYDVSISDDGNNLVAALWGNRGIRVFEKINNKFELVFTDKEYRDDTYYSRFSNMNKITIISSLSTDGYLRLYIKETNKKFFLSDKVLLKEKLKPCALSFKSSNQILVGYCNNTQIDIFEVVRKNRDTYEKYELKHIHSMKSKLNNGGSYSIAYSNNSIFTGGFIYNDENYVINKWTRDILTEIDINPNDSSSMSSVKSSLSESKRRVKQNSVLSMVSFKQGIIFVSDCIGIMSDGINLDGEHCITESHGNNQVTNELKTSYVGSRISFSTNQEGRALVYDVKERKYLDQELKKETKLYSPITQSNTLSVTDWKYSEKPKINNIPLRLYVNEKSLCVAISPNNENVLVGANWSIRFYDKEGNRKWIAPVLNTLSVNISSDGRYALAAFGDGTIRWYSNEDGKELLAFFPHSDQKRWVLWTPEGYYDSSKGGEDLIGWHINRGKDKESDFFSVGKFRDTYYRPDIITRVIEIGDTQKAIEEANLVRAKKGEVLPISKSLPSVVRILLPESGKPVKSEVVDFLTTIRSPSGLKVNELKVFIDDSLAETFPVDFTPSNSEDNTEFSFQLKVPQKKSIEISIVTVTEKGTSDPQRILLLGKQGAEKKPNLHLLSIGVGNYKDSKKVSTLHYSVADAKDFFAIMKKQEGKTYDQVNAEEKYLLTNETATRDNIINSILEIQNRSTPNDVTMIFLSGHGSSDVENRFYFLPHEYNTEKKHTTGLSGSELMTHLSKIKGKVILFVDACYSGSLSSGGLSMVRLLNEADDPNKRFVVFSSSSKFEESLEHPDWKNGAFTKAFKEAMLEGKLNKPKITIKGLDSYISERVPELTKNKQTPESQGTGRDFIIAESVK